MGIRVTFLALLAFVAGCGAPPDPPRLLEVGAPVAGRAGDAAPIDPRMLQKFQRDANAEREPAGITTAMINLGRMLWYDTRLSRSGEVSCNSCHDLERFGVDARPTSVGVDGRPGRRNAPTVYNAAEHFAMFWDGRSTSVEEQALEPLVNAREMAMTEAELLERLAGIPGYRPLYEAAFPDEAPPMTLATTARALGAFERGLVTPSRWHRFLAGEEQALSAAEIAGLRVFLEVGCTGCHTGPQIGASMFQRVGLVTPWPNQEDRGRFEITGVPTDAMVFKVPSLLNVAETAPYFHDGSVADLPGAVRAMARHQLGVQLDDARTDAIVTFLNALTGEIPTDYIARPQLPGAALVRK